MSTVNYCDYCNQPIHKEKYLLVIAKEAEIVKSSYTQDFKRKTYDVCESCQELIMNIFKFKKEKVKKIIEQIEKDFKL